MPKYRIKRSRLKQILVEKQVLQQDLADKVGVAESSISRYINTGRKIDVEIAYNIAKALGVIIDDLYEWEEID
nr:MAG TPA: helix-turn-helix domain protein [Caudoviricetes sp.]